MAIPNNTGRGQSQPLVLDQRFEVWPQEPLEKYNSPPALAYRCVDLKNTNTHCLAMVCDPHYPPRISQIKKMMEIQHPFLQRIYHYGVIDWVPENRRCPVLIVELPHGDRIMPSLTKSQAPMKEEEALMRFMRPAIRLLSEMRLNEITHRAIRPTNLFWGDRTHTKILLSECSSSPVGVTQPAIFETIESASSHPLGKGYGRSANDIYALGMTYFCLLTGTVPCVGVTDEEILNQKLLRGTYDLVVGSKEFSRMAFELLQGSLDDNPLTRWRVEDLLSWIGGKHYPLRTRSVRKSGQPFLLGGDEYYSARHLAQGLRKHWPDASKAVVEGYVDVWVRRYISDNDLVNSLRSAKEGLQSQSRLHVDRMVSRAITVLDPLGPLSFKSFTAMPDGIGNLVSLDAKNADTQVDFISMINSRLVEFWENNSRTDIKPLRPFLNDLQLVLNDVRTMRLGHGIERLRYQLNSDLPCLSGKLEAEFITDIKGLLFGLNRVAEENPEKLYDTLIDREIAAFIALRQNREFRAEFQAIESAVDPDLAVIQQVRVLASLQREVVPDTPLVQLCVASGRLLSDTLKRIKSAKNRARLKERVDIASEKGFLDDLISIYDDEEEISRDASEFVFAQAEFRNINNRVADLAKNLEEKDDLARIAGGHIASGVSGFVGCLITVAIFILQQFF